MSAILKTVMWGNSLGQYFGVLGVFLLSCVVILIVRKSLLKRLKSLSKKSSTSIDDYIVRLIKRVGVPFLYLGT